MGPVQVRIAAERAIDWQGMGVEGNTLLCLTDLTVTFASPKGIA